MQPVYATEHDMQKFLVPSGDRHPKKNLGDGMPCVVEAA